MTVYMFQEGVSDYEPKQHMGNGPFSLNKITEHRGV